ncbi:MAG TPA: L-aspartate oxidase [Candidatus Polarisedimenticolia bacterium]|nr:L-aspartate oxidase [Candidatus Polarisedimenticolia bacterium]
MSLLRSSDLASCADRRHDVVVVGSGVAGLRAAIEAAEHGLTVALLAKDSTHDSSTDAAQGGVAVALSDEDQVGLHHHDTIAAGDGLCDEAAVRVLVGEGPACITRLIDWGARFDREGTRLAFTREAAHSARRILHAQGDSTGREILRALWVKAASLDGIRFFPHTYSVDLLMDDGSCSGLRVLHEPSGTVLDLASRGVVLATGGLGQIYRETTNPPQSTGDGIAIAWRAGATLRDLEFVQFHPTSLHVPGAPRFLLSEALRGEGGVLRALDGRRFMPDLDPRAELAPRDIVARAIVREIERTGGGHVLLDLTHLGDAFLRGRFPRIHATCLAYGLDMARSPVPVAPAAHYVMGGVATDLHGRSSVPWLYAAGEAACTGVHGANRLASNSLLEGLVFGSRAGAAVVRDAASRRAGAAGRAAGHAPSSPSDREGEDAQRVKGLAWRRLGIVRDGAGVAEAAGELERLLASMDRSRGRGEPQPVPSRPGLESANMATVALLVALSAGAREESRGAHFRRDHPARDDVRFGRSSFIPGGGTRVVAGVAPEAWR